ncbi:MAG: hypothetical protein LAT63_00790 [Marinobacter sp.]|nr:hypothetical protein [Marinobacter sp.]
MPQDDKWPRETRAVKAVQLAFDLSGDIQRAFRVSAAMQDLTTSDMVRKALALPYKRRRIRPRLTLSLHPDDFRILAERYQLEPDDQNAIRKAVAEELSAFANRFFAEPPDSDT